MQKGRSGIKAEEIRALCQQIRDLEQQIRALQRFVNHLLPGDENERYEWEFPVETIYHIVPANYLAALPAE